MKILEAKYPIGSIPGQRTAGRYIDGMLYDNLRIMAKNITKDMTFLMWIFSSTLEVGTGKSVFASQVCEAWIGLVNEIHGKNLELTMQNCVFKPKDLIQRAFKVPKYSVIWLDEWEDTHYWSELGMSLRQFFRKCRQLNLFMVCIIPNFFQLPASYAVSRSIAAIDVQFQGEFERGYFRFFNFERKKDLYVKGKRDQNYNAAFPNFQGRFLDGYAVPEAEYRAQKLKDLTEVEEKDKKPTENEVKRRTIAKIFSNMTEFEKKRMAEIFQVTQKTIYEWVKGNLEVEDEQPPPY